VRAAPNYIGFKTMTGLLRLPDESRINIRKRHLDAPGPGMFMPSALLPAQIQKAAGRRAVSKWTREHGLAGRCHRNVDVELQEPAFGRLAGMGLALFVLDAKVDWLGDGRSRLNAIMDQTEPNAGSFGHVFASSPAGGVSGAQPDRDGQIAMARVGALK
jgi:hypothetical protein